MDNRMDTNEMISALADGRLQGEAFGRAVETVCSDPAAKATWHAYHLIGDVLRSRDPVAGAPAQAFVEKLSARLASEQAVPLAAAGMRDLGAGRHEAANDGSFRWKLVAGLASLAAVAAVGWSVLDAAPSTSGSPPQLALAPQSVPASGAPMTVMARSDSGVMIRDAKLDELLAAHRQLAGASALQVPAGFLRNATFGGPDR